MHVTFLEHRKPLTKIFSKAGSTSYPPAKRFTSHVEEIVSAEELYKVIIQHAEKKHCLYKGSLTQPIQNESRAGLTNTTEHNQLLVMDVDGLQLDGFPVNETVSEKDITQYATEIIKNLPEEFHNTCYTVQASASLGQKGDSLSLHFFFVLNKPLAPAAHKDLFQILNLIIPMFEKNMVLQPSGKTLHYPLDICMAQNSRIVYIAPPIFQDDLVDPVEVRTLYVQKEQSVVNIDNILKQMTIAQVENGIKTKIRKLRRNMGLAAGGPQYTTLRSADGTVQLLTNPDPMRMELSYINGDFAYFNINGGDSDAYYVKRSDPSIVHNFKDEPLFKFQDADPNTYYVFLDKYAITPETASGILPFIFRDIISAAHFNGAYNTENNDIVTLYEANKGDLEDYMLQYGHVLPSPIPTIRYEFKPETNQGVNMEDGWVNRYRPTELMKDAAKLDATDIGYATGLSLEDHCPLVFKILAHAFNYSKPELKHFINWLCYIIKSRSKTQTAWVLSGIPGTGKGVFFNKVMKPIMGDTLYNCLMPAIEDSFKGWVATSLLAVVDEFSMSAVKGKQDPVIAWLKSTITDPFGVARQMNTNPESTRNYLNFVFTSNQYDAMRIEEGDRRFNVAPRQEEKLDVRYPNIYDEIDNDLEKELPIFMQFINAYKVNDKAAHEVLENKTKRQMYSTTETSIAEFARCFRDADFGYFIENILNANDDHTNITMIAAKQVVKHWLQTIIDGTSIVFLADVSTVYSAIFNIRISPTKLSSQLQHYGIIKPIRVRDTHQQKLGWKMEFKLIDYNAAELVKQHFSPTDSKFLNKLSVIQDDLEANEHKVP